ncbi:DUF2865 domain-containing protein [Kaistia dalseonensis]|uniref:DUF2865 domain-containing protein n=1 Tax=Kaistia dalseonensis TaxID=410840 RepID=A0ABU0H4K6_9HYPH|nr:DUF2865 domain-containing protein [Kaistia dalseonensis]MCX5494219.1 DUF2865 domain-containing protein [Kaistia dalseonensis]MDQ0436798.1 hypothetical protein [Kaistia dalseonensis]
MSVDRVFLRVAIAAMFLGMGGGLAEAASAVCNSLESRLSSLQRGQSGGAGQAAALDGALNRQRAELNAANAQARNAGCRGFLIFKSKAGPECASINKNIARMEGNLAKLQGQRGRVNYDPASSNRQRSELLQQLGANNCGPQYAAYANSRPRNLLDMIFNPNGNVYAPQAPQGEVARIDQGGLTEPGDNTGGYDRGFGGGKYRTLCVRTCDGYYFPISFSTTRAGFATDEQICRQMCPGTDVALYAHRNPGQDSRQALSTTDTTPYSELPTAFAYRTSFNPICTCGKPQALDSVAGGYSPAAIGPFASNLAPVPVSAPSLGEDPETLANRAGNLSPVDIGKPNVATPVAGLTPLPPRSGAARRVGPSYFYAQ